VHAQDSGGHPTLPLECFGVITAEVVYGVTKSFDFPAIEEK
jgi:hypothetical protein